MFKDGSERQIQWTGITGSVSYEVPYNIQTHKDDQDISSDNRRNLYMDKDYRQLGSFTYLTYYES